MKASELKHHLDEIARETFPDTLQPWPTFQARLQASSCQPPQKGLAMKTQSNSTKAFRPAVRVTAIVVLALLFAGAVFLITPQGQALAQSLLRFFTRSQNNTMPVPTSVPLVWVEKTPGATEAAQVTPSLEPTLTGAAFSNQCGDFRSPTCSVEQIRKMVKFTVKELGLIPEPLHFIGATGGPDRVTLLYDTQDHSGFIVLTQEQWTGSAAQKNWINIGPNAVVETVQIGSLSGEYVKGSFGYRSGETQATWNDNAGMQNLRWVDNGVFMTIERAGPDGPGKPIDRDGLVAIAESMTTGPASAVATPLPSLTPTLTSVPETPEPGYQFTLSIAEAAQKAGFSVQAPTHLPQILTFVGASYDPATNFVRLSYTTDFSEGLMITEEHASDAAQCKICAFKVGVSADVWTDTYGSIVPKDIIQTVKIGNATGQYVEGMWENGWEWVPDPNIKRMRWQANGRAYEFFYVGTEISKEDMIRMAESMK